MTKNILCPLCNELRLECSYDGDIGSAIEFWDKYVASCRSCGYTDSQTISGGSPSWADNPTNCPYCGKQYCDSDKK